MSGLLELAERCECAPGRDRYLDADIALTQGWDKLPGDNWCGPTGGICVPDYTGSIDAAMTLVPDGLTFGCGGWDSTGKPWAWVGRNKDPKDELHLAEGGATPALALCAAALRARAAGDAE